jgi:hypothetical protein
MIETIQRSLRGQVIDLGRAPLYDAVPVPQSKNPMLSR